MDTRERKALINSGFEELGVTEQCSLLGLPRSTFYYRPVSASQQDLAVMRALDELYQEDSAHGPRHMSNELQKQGFDMGRDRTRSLMQWMRMKAIYCRRRTTICNPAKYKFPYLLRNLKINRQNQCLDPRHFLHSNRTRLHVFAGHHRLSMASKARSATSWCCR